MATVNNPEDQEQNQQSGAPVNVSGTGGASSSGQGAGGGATPAAPVSPVAQNTAPQNNAGYIDVGSYLDANKGGSQDLGNRVASNLTTDYGKTKGNIDNSAKSVQDLANNGYTHENSDLIQQAANNPVATAADQNNIPAVQAQLNDTYTGPTNWADFGTQQGNVAQAQQKGNLVNTPGGLNVLTQTVEGQTGRGQSQGINQLDTLLLGGSPEALQTVHSAADPYQGLNDYLNGQNTAVNSAITTGQTGAQTAAANAKAALLGPTGATGKLDTDVQSSLSGAQTKATAENARILQDTKNQQLSPEDLAALGISQTDYGNLLSAVNSAQTSQYMTGHNFGAASATAPVDLTSWLTQQDPNAAITAQNAATPEEYARAQALQQLVGSQNYSPTLTDPSMAGTAPKTLSILDYLDATKTAGDFGTQARSAAQDEANRLTAQADAQHNASKGGFLKKLTTPLTYLANPLLTVPAQLKAAKNKI